jgi:hypothetical protein
MICRSIDSLSALLGEYLRSHHVKPGSAEQLTITANLFSRWYATACGIPFHPGSFSEPLANDFLNDSLTARQWSPITANRKRRDLLTLWKYAAKKGFCEHYQHEDIIRFREPQRMPTAWMQEELGTFLAACPLFCQRRRAPAGWTYLLDQATVMVIYDTAYRLHACLELRTENLRDDGAILALAETQKTLCDEEKWLGPDTMRKLVATDFRAREFVLPWPYGKRALRSRWKKILRIAGLQATRRDGPQKMRRTSVSWLEHFRPGSAKAHLRHKTSGLAEKHYLCPLIVQPGKAFEHMPRIAVQQRQLF